MFDILNDHLFYPDMERCRLASLYMLSCLLSYIIIALLIFAGLILISELICFTCNIWEKLREKLKEYENAEKNN